MSQYFNVDCRNTRFSRISWFTSDRRQWRAHNQTSSSAIAERPRCRVGQL